MAKKFLSFLGTNDYVECNYECSVGKVESVRYVQEATIKLFCRDWGKNDSAIFFLTSDARRSNWENQNDKNRRLKDRLRELNIPISIIEKDIPDGIDEDELYNIFSAIYESIESKDEVVFDITHALRSIPMLAIVVLNYSKILKNVEVRHILYGAFETLGTKQKVEKMDIKDRNAPILDLIALVKIQDWTTSSYNFVKNGITKDICGLMDEDVKPILRRTEGKDEMARKLNTLSKAMKEFEGLFSTVRGREILERKTIDEKLLPLLKDLASSETFIKPLNPILKNLYDRIIEFSRSEDKVSTGLNAVAWCFEHGLIQQSITLMQELIITKILIDAGYEWRDKKFRDLASQSVYIKSRDIPEDSWDISEENKGCARKMMNLKIVEEIKGIYSQLSIMRNDINHGGFTYNSKNSNRISEESKKVFENLLEVFSECKK